MNENRHCSTPGVGRHAAHVYTDSHSLGEVVAAFAHEALRQREGVLLIATPEHMQLIEGNLAGLGVDVAALRASGQIQCHDAHKTLEYLMDGDQPSKIVFDGLVCDAIAQLTARRFTGVAAFGEMVNILCERGNPEAARTLEGWWDVLIDQYGLSLLCGYRARPLDPDDQEVMDLALRTHDHLTVEDGPRLCTAVDRALCETFPHGDAETLRSALAQSAGGPGHEQTIAALAGLRRLMPRVADDVMRLARGHCHIAEPHT